LPIGLNLQLVGISLSMGLEISLSIAAFGTLFIGLRTGVALSGIFVYGCARDLIYF